MKYYANRTHFFVTFMIYFNKCHRIYIHGVMVNLRKLFNQNDRHIKATAALKSANQLIKCNKKNALHSRKTTEEDGDQVWWCFNYKFKATDDKIECVRIRLNISSFYAQFTQCEINFDWKIKLINWESPPFVSILVHFKLVPILLIKRIIDQLHT